MSHRDLMSTLREMLGLSAAARRRTRLASELEAIVPPQCDDVGTPRSRTRSLTGAAPARGASLSSPTSRIEWTAAPEPTEPARPRKPSRRKSTKIDWGAATDGGAADYSNLVGVEDAYDHTPLLSGEPVAFCTRDKVAYHLSTWEFLKHQNQGRCCVCGQPNVVTIVTLPGVLPGQPVTLPPPVHPGILRPGEVVIGLKEVHNHIGLAVTVQDFVYEAYQTKNTGTYFLRFEPRGPRTPVFDGFKVVIFPNYQPAWERAGISIRSYQGQHVRVRGVIQVHAEWGIEVLVNSPQVIEVVSGAKVQQ